MPIPITQRRPSAAPPATLVLHREGARLRVENGAFAIERPGEETVAIPAHLVGEILCYGSVGLTGSAVSLALRHGCAIAFFGEDGACRARIQPVGEDADADSREPATPGADWELARAQWRLALDGDPLPWARSFLCAKLANARGMLLRGRRRDGIPADEAQGLETAIAATDRALRHATEAPTVESLRGHEGAAARAWFAAMPLLMVPEARAEFAFVTRSRRPPRDPFNALLSFLYALLLHDVIGALQAAGLDIRPGFLHEPRRGVPALALDLMEELRPALADRLALALVNRRQLRPEHFQPDDAEAGVRLTREGLRILFDARRRRAMEAIPHPVAPGGRARVADVPRLQAAGLCRAIRAGDPAARHPFTPDL